MSETHSVATERATNVFWDVVGRPHHASSDPQASLRLALSCALDCLTRDLRAIPAMTGAADPRNREEPNGWRDDMENAPRGAPSEPPIPLLLSWTYMHEDGVGFTRGVGEAYWSADSEDWWWANTAPDGYWNDSIGQSITGKITHWQPLPLPPSQESEGS